MLIGILKQLKSMLIQFFTLGLLFNILQLKLLNFKIYYS